MNPVYFLKYLQLVYELSFHPSKHPSNSAQNTLFFCLLCISHKQLTIWLYPVFWPKLKRIRSRFCNHPLSLTLRNLCLYCLYCHTSSLIQALSAKHRGGGGGGGGGGASGGGGYRYGGTNPPSTCEQEVTEAEASRTPEDSVCSIEAGPSSAIVDTSTTGTDGPATTTTTTTLSK